MKILQLVTSRQYRGAEVFAANLSAELIDLGHEIIFAGLYKNSNDILQVDKALNVDLAVKKKGFLSPVLVKKLIELVKSSKPDVIQCNGSDTLKYMVAASYFIPEVPIVYRNISMISEWVDGVFKKILYKNLFKRIAHVSSVGDEAVEDFVKTFDYPRTQTSVIRRGIPIKELRNGDHSKDLKTELGLKEKDKIALHIGNFSPEKNHKFLINIFSELKNDNPEIKLVCVGNGILFETITAEIQERGLGDTIFLLGFRKDIPELLAASDCFVLSSTVEGVPGVILEAGTQRIPSVATNVGGTSEVLINGKTGYLIDDFNHKEFKEKLLTLLSSDELRRDFGENAYKLVFNEYNPLKNARKFEDLYFQLSGGRKENLKILQLIQAIQYRGAEVFCCQLSNHLINLGNKVDVVSIYDGAASLPFNGEVKSLNRKKNRKYLDFGGWKTLAEYIRSQLPDVIQANAADTLKYAVFSKLIYRWKTPIVYRNASIASFYINDPWAKQFHGFLLKEVDLVISVSEASKQDLNNLYPFTRKKSIVIPIGLDQNLANQGSNKSDKEKIIIHVGSFTEEKNHKGLIKIFREVLDSGIDVILQLVGEGPLKAGILKEVKEDNILSSRVQFVEPVTNPLVMIGAANVLVLPSKVEGLPGVLIEAMSTKTPVIAYDVGGISEIVTHKTGQLIEKNNEKKFALAVVNALNNPDENQIKEAFIMVRENYLNEKIAKRFLKAYQTLLP